MVILAEYLSITSADREIINSLPLPEFLHNLSGSDIIHASHVAEFSKLIGSEIGLDKKDLHDLDQGGALHDIGKCGIPEHILNYEGPLSNENKSLVETHVLNGGSITYQTPELRSLVPIIATYHESYDGTGYPFGLKGERIPFAARIIAVADAFDAMISDRPYRKALSYEQVVAYLKQNRGLSYDPELIDIFLKIPKHIVDEIKQSEVNINTNGLLKSTLQNAFGQQVYAP